MRITKAQLIKILNIVSLECKAIDKLDLDKVKEISNKYIPCIDDIYYEDDIYYIRLDVIYDLPKNYFVEAKRNGINLFDIKTTYIEFCIIEIPFDNLILVDCNLCHVLEDKIIKIIIGEKTLEKIA